MSSPSPAFPGGLWLHRCIVESSEVQHMSQMHYFCLLEGMEVRTFYYASLTGPRSRRAGTSAQRGPSTFDGCRLQCMNVLQVAVGPSVVNPVSHHEHIGHLKSHVLHVQVARPPRGLGEKGSNPRDAGLRASRKRLRY